MHAVKGKSREAQMSQNERKQDLGEEEKTQLVDHQSFMRIDVTELEGKIPRQ